VLSYALHFAPKGEVRWQQDPWGNRVARLTMRAGEALREFAVTVDLAVDVQPVNPFDFFVDDRCREVPFTYPDGLDVEVVRSSVLRWVASNSTDPHEREHVTLGVYRRRELFALGNFAGEVDLSGLRWTVDTPEDLRRMEQDSSPTG
jgi:spore coat polysaccharide biosynthesis protein SpsF (cytidylyltransferase family)